MTFTKGQYEGDFMPDYKTMYFSLAGKLASTIETLDHLSEHLKEAQRHKEEEFIKREEKFIKNARNA